MIRRLAMLQSLRYALRMLFKTPGFTLVSVLSLAVGIGATSAQFSIGDAMLMRPLPVPEPSRVVAVTSASSAAFGANAAISYPDYRDFRDSNHSFETLLASGFSSFGYSLNQTTVPKITFGVFVSGNYFRALGVQPALGRDFLPSEDQAVGRDTVVVLGHDFWLSQFGGSAAAIGSPIFLNGIHC